MGWKKSTNIEKVVLILKILIKKHTLTSIQNINIIANTNYKSLSWNTNNFRWLKECYSKDQIHIKKCFLHEV